MEESVRVEMERPLAWVVVDRPERRNAIDSATWTRLAEAVGRVGADPSVRVVVVRGSGDQAFISGADITELLELRGNAEMTAAYDRLAIGAWQAIAAAPKPVIGMVNGACYGGGVLLALACDLRVAAEHASFAIPAAKLGLSYPTQGIERLVRVVGPTWAAHMLLSGAALSAAEALQARLVNRVVPGDELENAVRTQALRMAEGAPLTLEAHKRAIQNVLATIGERDDEPVAAAVRRCLDSEDHQEGIRAFLEKRKPDFRGR